MVKNQKASLTLPSFMSRCKAALKEQMPNGCHMMQQLKGPTYIFSRLTHGTPRTFHANTKAGVISFVVLPPPLFPGCSLWLQPCVTHLKSANYTHAQSLIEAVDIEQPAVVNYFFAILPGKATQTSVKQRSVSLKSIHPALRALA